MNDEFNSILELLEESGVFCINKLDSTKVELVENCDRHYSQTLTKSQLMLLATELSVLADTLD